MRSRNAISAYLVGIVVISIFSGVQTMSAEGKDGSFGGGDGTTGNPYVIEDVWDLRAMGSDLGAHYVLSGDIDASATAGWNSGAGFAPVGNLSNGFAGSLDGRNHTIRGLSIDRPTTDNVGLFGLVSAEGTVRDVGLVDDEVSGHTCVGALVGRNNGTVANSWATGSVTGTYYSIGGLLGSNIGTVTGCSAKGTVTGGATSIDVGGLTGSTFGSVDSSHSAATVKGWNGVGGLAGRNSNGMVRDSYATGDVSGDVDVGGLLGTNYDGTVTGSHASGNVSDLYGQGGGLVGQGDGRIADSHATGNVTGRGYGGGLVGYDLGNITRCYATGSVTGTHDLGGLAGGAVTVSFSYATGAVSGINNLGGLVGSLSLGASDSYATGDVTGTQWYVGGLVGWNIGTVFRTYSVGSAVGADVVGGLVGGNDGTVSSSFWDTESSGRSTSDGGTGRTTAQMRARATFTGAGWDFATVWGIAEGVTYPLLRWQDASPPVAEAGADQVVEAGATTTFDGSGSTDDLGISDYSWSFVYGSFVTLHSLRPTAAYQFDCPGTYVVTLNVTDIGGHWDLDTMNVTVSDLSAPVAHAGIDQTVDEGTLVTFDGRGSSDNVKVVNYTWTFIDGVPVSLYDIGPVHQFRSPGTFVVTLNVTDAAGNWDMDMMTVTVNDTTPPVAEAGPDQTVDEGAVVVFDASGSTDNDCISGFLWTFSDGGPVTLEGIQPVHRFDTPGEFLVTLNVTDSSGHWATDTLTVTVRDLTPPVAEAGQDFETDEDTTIMLNGTGSTDNVGIVDYVWTFQGPIGMPAAVGPTPTVYFIQPGVYDVTLTVSDAAGLQASDVATVTVRDVTLPVAEAGPDRTVNEGDIVTLDASGSTDNVGIVNYTWTFSYGTVETVLYGASPFFTFKLIGHFSIMLGVADAAGHVSTDTMSLTVRDHTPPRADAGPDRTVPVDSPVSLDGSLSTDNAGIEKHTWSFIYDGVPVVLRGPVSPFTFAKGGVYIVKLGVLDLAGNYDDDEVVITVVDTGRVIGTVLDEKGRPVEGARVELTRSNGTTCSTTTGANGSFAVDIFHGNFNWSISKEGYRTISGRAAVKPMDATELGLSNYPLVRETEDEPPMLLFVMPVVISLVAVIAVVLSKKKKRSRKEPEK